MLYVTFFFTITLFLYGLYVLKEERKKRLKRRLSNVFDRIETKESEPTEDSDKQQRSLYQRIFAPIWKEFKRSFKKSMPGEKEAKLEVKLLKAGNPLGMTPVEFRLIQIGLFIGLPLLAWGYAQLMQLHSGGIVFFLLIGLVLALFIPNFYIKQKTKQRNHAALKELPDILDLLTVSLEAGLGFDSAISKLVSKKEGVLPSEFHRCLEEIRLGKTRREALSGIRERLDVDEIKMLISSILQAEKLGIGMVQVLRVQSSEVREQRKQRAEEEAMKAPIKMLFPLVIFIFPTIFIVLLGPAVIDFLNAF
ncbi:tight adherence protein C [Salirhabdus euzebyi]|uniref:Tight adherence protein C n=1 Tax=Salirhabdus euzebyi TaxID=394506 RepID=A0A841Q9N0_9BACI|nr:type II secretion system F family protein [Salirhabdus euzebyi]MBB6455106.1 tight adherence protein C [Salirhabdus euzebyi]